MKRFLGVACALLILFVNAPMAFAASSSPADAVDTENFDDALEYISSQEVKSQIYNEIDFNKEGTQLTWEMALYLSMSILRTCNLQLERIVSKAQLCLGIFI